MSQENYSHKGHDFGETTGRIIGAAIEVHRELGPGFQEVVYQRALERELRAVGIEYTRECDVPVFYKGDQIDTRRVDFVVEDVIVEIKARAELLPQDHVQTICYLKASGFRVALLLNFGAPKLGIDRYANDRRSRHTSAEAMRQGPSA